MAISYTQHLFHFPTHIMHLGIVEGPGFSMTFDFYVSKWTASLYNHFFGMMYGSQWKRYSNTLRVECIRGRGRGMLCYSDLCYRLTRPAAPLTINQWHFYKHKQIPLQRSPQSEASPRTSSIDSSADVHNEPAIFCNTNYCDEQLSTA